MVSRFFISPASLGEKCISLEKSLCSSQVYIAEAPMLKLHYIEISYVCWGTGDFFMGDFFIVVI